MESIKAFFERLDKLLCVYIGLENDNESASALECNSSKIWILFTNSFRRHYQKQALEDFFNSKFSNVSNKDKEKIGLALGKAIADDLIISFTSYPPAIKIGE